eukprot:2807233-Pleurochrysis_carterae.AAC.1
MESDITQFERAGYSLEIVERAAVHIFGIRWAFLAHSPQLCRLCILRWSALPDHLPEQLHLRNAVAWYKTDQSGLSHCII